MATRLTTDETKIAFDGIRQQIKDLEGSIQAVYSTGRGPTGVEIGMYCALSIAKLTEAREKLESLICWFDS